MELANFEHTDNEFLEHYCNTSRYSQCSNDSISHHFPPRRIHMTRTSRLTSRMRAYSLWINILVIILLAIIEGDKLETAAVVDGAYSPASSLKKYSTGEPHDLYHNTDSHDPRGNDDENTDLDLDLDLGDGSNDRSRNSGNRMRKGDGDSDVRKMNRHFDTKDPIKVEDSIVVSLEDPVSNEIEPYYDDSQDVIVIATVDGTFYGISTSTGETKWKKQGIDLKNNNSSSDDSKPTQVDSLKKALVQENDSLVDVIFAPLTSTSSTKSPNKGGRTSKSRTESTRAIPSVDGRVFLDPGKNNDRFEQPVNDLFSSSSSIKVRDLVSRSPFVDSQGRIFIGSSYSSATALDRDTGEVLSFMRIEGGMNNEDETSFGNWNEHNQGDNHKNIVWVGRVDYTVSVYSSSGDADVEFSTSEVMSLTNLINQQGIYNPALVRPSPIIVATPGGKLAMCDSNSDKPLWIAEQTFDTPVAYALESKHGKSLRVDFIPDAPVNRHFSKEYLSRNWKSSISDNAGAELGESDSRSISWAHNEKDLFVVPIGRRQNYNHFPELPYLHNDSIDMNTGSKAISQLASNQRGNPQSLFYTAYFASLKNSRDDNKSWFYKFLKSWTQPAIVLAFIVSFEIGRRSRTNKEKMDSELQDGRPSTTPSSAIESIEGIARRKNDQGQGAIKISDEILGYGGHGTIVYKGELDGRHVAVKRMLKAYHSSAEREISLLIESDGHPHVVRYFLKETRGDFVYLALELCEMTLEDLITALRQKKREFSLENGEDGKPISVLHMPRLRGPIKEALFEVAQGVKHIHSLRIVHRDLKPQNILLAKKAGGTNILTKRTCNDSVYRAFREGIFSPKISDMGLGKQLTGHSSFGLSTFNTSFRIGDSGLEESIRAGPGPGTVGWQAREVMAHRPISSNGNNDNDLISMMEASPMESSLSNRTSRSVDIFSLGCIFYYSLLPGSHPFGEWYERESNIMKNCPSLKALEDLAPDASDLIRRMIDSKPSARPNALQVCSHPFFWTESKRLSFICDLSDRLEHDAPSANDAKCVQTNFLDALIFEQQAVDIVGTAWGTRLDQDFFNSVTKFRMYDQSCVRDLLRLIRNKHHHFDEIPLKVKEKVVSNQQDLLTYFESKFPRLFMHCYNVCCSCLAKNDPLILKYDIQSKLQPQNDVTLKEKDNIVSRPSESKNIPDKVTPGSNMLPRDFSCSSEVIEEIPSSRHAQHLTLITPSDHKNDVKILNNDNEETKGLASKKYVSQSSVIAWEGSNTCSTLGCRGWMRSEDEWINRTDKKWMKVDLNIKRSAQDEIFRTRLCNHWDMSQGVCCPIKKKNRCVFAHGPVELRVKEGKIGRWGKLVDKDGNNSNPFHSGGEDTYGAAKSIETARKEEGKWKSHKKGKQRGKGPNPGGRKRQNPNKQ